jgi:hypothetical protein
MENTSLKAIATNSWARRLHHPCEIIGETKIRYRVRMLEEALLPGGRRRKAVMSCWCRSMLFTI